MSASSICTFVLVKLLKNKLRVSCGVVRGVLRCTHSVAKAREFVKYLYVGTSNASKLSTSCMRSCCTRMKAGRYHTDMRHACQFRTYAGVCWRMLAYSGVCWRMLAYAGVCWHACELAGITRTWAITLTWDIESNTKMLEMEHKLWSRSNLASYTKLY